MSEQYTTADGKIYRWVENDNVLTTKQVFMKSILPGIFFSLFCCACISSTIWYLTAPERKLVGAPLFFALVYFFFLYYYQHINFIRIKYSPREKTGDSRPTMFDLTVGSIFHAFYSALLPPVAIYFVFKADEEIPTDGYFEGKYVTD